jgi:hypothetical protein
MCELCDVDADCCSGSCVAQGPGPKRCAKTACGADGEVCNANAQCCAAQSLACGVDSTSAGALRCEHVVSCAADGTSCAVSRECCGGKCVPASGLQCSSACVADGSRCTCDADCCGAKTSSSVCMRLAGELVCVAL